MSQIELYLSLFFLAIFFSTIFVFSAKKISTKYNLYDNPESDSLKIHKIPVSFLGGFAILGSLLVCLLLLWVFNKNQNFGIETSKIISVFVGSIIVWLYGFWDDTYWHDRKKISQELKIILQVPIVFTIALIFYVVQIKYQFLDFPLIGIFIAAFLFLFIENAVNLQDGLDGLAPSIVLISSLAFLVFFILNQNIFGAVISIIITGAVSAFLFFNWHLASIFLGNNGSYFLGFIMVVLAILASSPGRFFYSFLPYFFIGSPIFNVFYVFIKRGIKRKSFFRADREHLHYDLLSITNSVPKSVAIICSMHLFFIFIGLFLIIFFK